jgi:hypothetical protein
MRAKVIDKRMVFSLDSDDARFRAGKFQRRFETAEGIGGAREENLFVFMEQGLALGGVQYDDFGLRAQFDVRRETGAARADDSVPFYIGKIHSCSEENTIIELKSFNAAIAETEGTARLRFFGAPAGQTALRMDGDIAVKTMRFADILDSCGVLVKSQTAFFRGKREGISGKSQSSGSPYG